MKREIPPDVRALIVSSLARALAEAWRCQRRDDQQDHIIEREPETAEASR